MHQWSSESGTGVIFSTNNFRIDAKVYTNQLLNTEIQRFVNVDVHTKDCL